MPTLQFSPQWTPEERLKLIKARAEQLYAILQCDMRGHLIDRAPVEAYLQHIRLLSTASAEMLEANRLNLLNTP